MASSRLRTMGVTGLAVAVCAGAAVGIVIITSPGPVAGVATARPGASAFGAGEPVAPAAADATVPAQVPGAAPADGGEAGTGGTGGALGPAPGAAPAPPAPAAAPPVDEPAAAPAAPAPAQQAAPPAPEPAAEPAPERRLPLLEMITADRRGRFYTLNPVEAAAAARKHGFVRTDESAGITLLAASAPGTVPVHRLRLGAGHQAYLLTVDPQEIERLKGWFHDEGVVGFVYTQPGEGRMELTRYNKDGDWRVARAGRPDLMRAGFTVDGPLGYVPRG